MGELEGSRGMGGCPKTVTVVVLSVSSECLCFRGMELPLSNQDHVYTRCRDDTWDHSILKHVSLGSYWHAPSFGA